MTKISSNDKHRNRLVGKRKKKIEKPTLLYPEQPVCALLIWIPHEKVQVIESLLKQASEKKIFFFCFKVGGKKNGKQTGFLACSLQRGFL